MGVLAATVTLRRDVRARFSTFEHPEGTAYRLGQCLIAFSARDSMYSFHLAGSFMRLSNFRINSSSSGNLVFVPGVLFMAALASFPIV